MLKSALLLILVVVLSGCQTIQNKNVSEFKSTFKVGDVYENQVKVAEYYLPLLEGKQTIIALEEKTYNNSYVGAGPMPGMESKSSVGRLVFANIDGDTIRNVTLLNVSLYSNAGLGWQVQKPCKRKDVVHYVVDSDAMRDQNCWIANHLRLSSAGKVVKVVKEAFKYARKHKLRMPENIFGTNHVVAKKNGMIRTRYYFNPEVYNVSPSKRMEWASSDWHMDRIHMFEDKKNFADAVIKWGERWQELHVKGHNGVSVAEDAYRFQSPFETKDKPAPVKNEPDAGSQGIKEKLVQLKSMFEGGLITEDEYSAAKKRLLDRDL